ncbi:MAG: hypothetical protein ACRENO_03590, partial [Thermodesulfobacteriota bacterium]
MKNEVSKQMETLSLQAAQAEEYKNFTEELKLLEYKILNKKLEKSADKKSLLLEQKKNIEKLISELKSTKDEKTNQLINIEDAGSEINIEVERSEKELYELKSDLQEKNSYQNFALKEAEAIDQYINRLKYELSVLAEELDTLEKNKIEKSKEIEKLKISKACSTDELKEKENNLSSLREKSSESKNSLDQAGKNIFDALNQQSSLGSTKVAFTKELEELAARKDTIDEQLKKLAYDKDETDKELSRFQSEEGKIKNEFELGKEEKQKVDSALYDLRIEHEKKTGELNQIETRISECSSKINFINHVQANYEWLPESTRDFILKQKGNGVLGIISDFVFATKDYERAVEAAFGEKLNWIVVEENKEAIYAIESLRASSVGRGTFIPIKDRFAKNSHEKNGYKIKSVNELINISGIDTELIESILPDVYVASDLREALNKKAEIGNGACFATLQGDYVDSSGAITGGFNSGGVFERKREIEELKDELSELKSRLDTTRLSAAAIKEEMTAKEIKSAELGELLKKYEIKSVENIKDQSNLENKIENIQRQLDNLNFENSNIIDKLGNKNQRLEEIDEILINLENKKKLFDQEFKKFEELLLGFNEEEKQLQEQITRLKIENASIYEKERSFEYEINEIDKRKSITEEKISLESKEIEIKNAEKINLLVSKEKTVHQLDKLKISLIEKENALSYLKEKRLELKTAIDETKNLISEVNEKLGIENSNLNNLEIKLSSIMMEIQHLNEQLETAGEERERNINYNIPASDEQFDIEEAEKQFKNIKKKVEDFGLVNLLAPEEFKKLKERNDFLFEQTEDLEKAMASLLQA